MTNSKKRPWSNTLIKSSSDEICRAILARSVQYPSRKCLEDFRPIGPYPLTVATMQLAAAERNRARQCVVWGASPWKPCLRPLSSARAGKGGAHGFASSQHKRSPTGQGSLKTASCGNFWLCLQGATRQPALPPAANLPPALVEFFAT